jgi:hypothetical protein
MPKNRLVILIEVTGPSCLVRIEMRAMTDHPPTLLPLEAYLPVGRGEDKSGGDNFVKNSAILSIMVTLSTLIDLTIIRNQIA